MFKRILVTVLLVGLMAVPAMASDAIFKNVSTTGASSTSVSCRSPWQSSSISFTNVSALTMVVQGSNGLGWSTISTHVVTAAEIAAGVANFSTINEPRDLCRHNITVLTESGSSLINSRHLAVSPSRP